MGQVRAVRLKGQVMGSVEYNLPTSYNGYNFNGY